MLLYSQHLGSLKAEFPAFDSQIIRRGYPSDVEYVVLLPELKSHKKKLEDVAQEIWKSGEPMDFSDEKEN